MEVGGVAGEEKSKEGSNMGRNRHDGGRGALGERDIIDI